jgi:hydrogenase large subunit
MMVNGDYRNGMTFSSGAAAGATTYKVHADTALSGLTAASFVAGVSTMDRHRARALEARKIAIACAGWLDELAATTGYTSGNVSTAKSYPSETSAATLGVGMAEAPRGSVGHWTQVRYDKIERYEVIAPTSWNGSGRDPSGNAGPIEKALEGINLSGVQSSGSTTVPVEALRVVHSFDPCIACSVHTISKRGCKR